MGMRRRRRHPVQRKLVSRVFSYTYMDQSFLSSLRVFRGSWNGGTTSKAILAFWPAATYARHYKQRNTGVLTCRYLRAFWPAATYARSDLPLPTRVLTCRYLRAFWPAATYARSDLPLPTRVLTCRYLRAFWPAATYARSDLPLPTRAWMENRRYNVHILMTCCLIPGNKRNAGKSVLWLTIFVPRIYQQHPTVRPGGNAFIYSINQYYTVLYIISISLLSRLSTSWLLQSHVIQIGTIKCKRFLCAWNTDQPKHRPKSLAFAPPQKRLVDPLVLDPGVVEARERGSSCLNGKLKRISVRLTAFGDAGFTVHTWSNF